MEAFPAEFWSFDDKMKKGTIIGKLAYLPAKNLMDLWNLSVEKYWYKAS